MTWPPRAFHNPMRIRKLHLCRKALRDRSFRLVNPLLAVRPAANPETTQKSAGLIHRDPFDRSRLTAHMQFAGIPWAASARNPEISLLLLPRDAVRFTAPDRSNHRPRPASMGERVGWEDRVVKDHCLGLAAQETELQLLPVVFGALVRPIGPQPIEPGVGLRVMPELVMSEGQEDPVLGQTLTASLTDAFLQAANGFLEPPGP